MQERVTLGGTDGFRGHAELARSGPGIINEETFAGITAAHISILQENGADGPVVIGRDTRPSGYSLKQAVIAGAKSQGAEILDLDIVPTSTAQKVAQSLGAMATVVVTASHNHVNDNGWKGMIGSDKPSKLQSKAISDRYWEMQDNGFVIPRYSSDLNPKEHDKYSIEYGRAVIGDIREAFGNDRPLEGKIIVVDGAYGAGKEMTPAILRSLGATVEEFACDDSGLINERSGAADLEGLHDFLSARPNLLNNPNFLGAVANDGDADRMMAVGVVSKDGNNTLVNIDGNHVMWALAQNQPGIIGTEYTNSGLVTKLAANNIDFEYCANGDVFVTEGLRAKQAVGQPWQRGGEFTGHHVDLEWLSSGDGVRMAAWFAAWSVQNGINFGHVHKELPLWHEEMQKVKTGKLAGSIILKDELLQKTREQIENEFGVDGRFILRPSGTEPVFRIWGEGKDRPMVADAVRRLKSIVDQRVLSEVSQII